MPLAIRVMVIVVFSYFGLSSLAGVLRRKIAFRVDQTGITLGGGPFRYGATTRFFPWANISQIIIWQRQIPFTVWRWTVFSIPIRYIGLQRRADAPPVSGDATGRLDRPDSRLRYQALPLGPRGTLPLGYSTPTSSPLP